MKKVLAVLIVLVVSTASAEVTDCYGPFNEKCTCEFNKRTGSVQIVCPTRQKSTMAGRDITRQLKRKRDRDAGVALLQINNRLLAIKKR